MKTLFAIIASVAIILFTGCKTTTQVTTNPDGSTVTNIVRIIDVVRVEHAATSAASIGTTVALLQNPTYRPAFEAAVIALYQLEGKDTVSIDDVRAILIKLPIKELKSTNAKIGIALADQVFLSLNNDKLSLNRNEAVKAFSHGIYLGMKTTLEE